MTRKVKLTKSVMQSVTMKIDVQSKKPAMKSNNKKSSGLASDKNCQDTISNCEYNDSKSQSTMKVCSDKKCQENINMQPVKPQMDVQLTQPAK